MVKTNKFLEFFIFTVNSARFTFGGKSGSFIKQGMHNLLRFFR